MLTNLIEYILNYKSISSFIIFTFYLLLLLIFFLRKNHHQTNIFIIFLFSFFYLLSGSFITPLISPGSINIPLLLKIQDNSLFSEDIFVKAGMQSPKIIFAYLIYYLNFLNLDILFFYNLTQNLIIVFSPILFFSILIKIIENNDFYFSFKNLNKKLRDFLLIFLLVINIFIILKYQSPKSLADWNIFFWIDSSLDPHYLSIFINLIGLWYCLNFKKNFLFYVANICSTLIHPVISIGFLVYFSILTIKKNDFFFFTSFLIKRLCLPFLILFCISSFLVIFFKEGGENYADINFTKVYIFFHYNHYKFLSFSNIFTFFWLFFPFIVSLVFFKKKHLFMVSLLIFVFIFGSFLFHYLAAELLEISLASKLGSTRMVVFSSSLYFLILIKIIDEKNILNSLNNKNYFLEKKYTSSNYSKYHILFYFFLVIFSFSLLYKKDNFLANNILKYHNNFNIRKDTGQMLKYFLHEPKTTLINTFDTKIGNVIRVFSQKNIFFDNFFPFNEIYFLTYKNRYLVHAYMRSIYISKPKDFMCLSSKNGIDYHLFSDKNEFKIIKQLFHKNIAFINDNYLIIKINETC